MDGERPLELTDEEIVTLPVDELGLRVLRHVADSQEWNSYNWMNTWRNLGYRQGTPVLRALAEAWNWSYSSGLVAPTLDDTGYAPMFVTRLGRAVLERGLPYLTAVQRISAHLHPRIARVRRQFLLGEFELAAFAAMREVEMRVRELSGADHADIGQRLMRAALNPESKPLRDPASEAGERQGISDLFAGAIAMFKNPTSHRQVAFDDPTEAAEVVTLASLLLRILDRRATSGGA